jgi:hypothetical protein
MGAQLGHHYRCKCIWLRARYLPIACVDATNAHTMASASEDALCHHHHGGGEEKPKQQPRRRMEGDSARGIRQIRQYNTHDPLRPRIAARNCAERAIEGSEPSSIAFSAPNHGSRCEMDPTAHHRARAAQNRVDWFSAGYVLLQSTTSAVYAAPRLPRETPVRKSGSCRERRRPHDPHTRVRNRAGMRADCSNKAAAPLRCCAASASPARRAVSRLNAPPSHAQVVIGG